MSEKINVIDQSGPEFHPTVDHVAIAEQQGYSEFPLYEGGSSESQHDVGTTVDFKGAIDQIEKSLGDTVGGRDKLLEGHDDAAALANQDKLDEVRKNRSTFAKMGAVALATAAIAVSPAGDYIGEKVKGAHTVAKYDSEEIPAGEKTN